MQHPNNKNTRVKAEQEQAPNSDLSLLDGGIRAFLSTVLLSFLARSVARAGRALVLSHLCNNERIAMHKTCVQPGMIPIPMFLLSISLNELVHKSIPELLIFNK